MVHASVHAGGKSTSRWQSIRAGADAARRLGKDRGVHAVARIVYELRVSGDIPPDLLSEFDGMTVTVAPAETVLYGPLPDQSALFGLLTRIDALGLRLVEVRWLAGEDPGAYDESRQGTSGTR